MPFTFAPFLNPKAKEDKTRHVLIRITKDRVHRYLSTGIYVRESEYNAKNKRRPIRGSLERANTQNNAIADLLDALEAFGLANPAMSSAQLKQVFEQQYEPEEKLTFSSFWQKEIQRIAAEHKIRTRQKYESEYAKLHAFAGKDTVEFEQLTLSFAKDYRAYLSRIGNAPTTREKSLQFLSRMVTAAMKEGLIQYQDNPFHFLKIKRPRGKKDTLTQQEIALIRSLDLPTNRRIYHSRNIFLCQFYMQGSRIGDMLLLRRKHLVLFDTGKLLYRFSMEKTGAEAVATAFPALTELLLPYLYDKQPEDFVFPFLDNSRDYSDEEFLIGQLESATTTINQDLKRIEAMLAELTGVHKHITTHVARHSFAQITRSVTGDVYATSKALKHSGVSETENYLGQDNQALIEKASSAAYESIEEAARNLLNSG